MNTSLHWVLLAIAVGAGLVGAAAAAAAVVPSARAPRTPVGFTDVARGVVVIVAVGGVATLGGILTGRVGFFGVFTLWWFLVVVGLPVLSGASMGWVLVRWRGRRVTGPAGAALVLGLLAGAVGVWGSVIEPYRLEVDRPAPLALPETRAGSDPLRIGVLTDLQTVHVGDHESRAVDLLMAERPDLILLPGDVFQGSREQFDRELPALQELFGRLHAPGGVFIVHGDVDPAISAPNEFESPHSVRLSPAVPTLDEVVRGTDVQVLRQEVVFIRVGDRMVQIAGSLLDPGPEGTGRLVEQFSRSPEVVRILLAHRPDVVLDLPDGISPDLVVAGHTHGGQISVPFVGPILTLSDVPRHVAAGGLHPLEGTHLYVGRGVGMERGQAPPVRLGVPPNVGILILQ